MVTEHRTVTMMQLRNNTVAYYNTVSRVVQNAYHMYNALIVSILKELRQHIMVVIDQARINGVGNRPMLFNLIMSECTLDTPATVMRL